MQFAGIFSSLSTFSHFLRDELSSGFRDREGPFSVWHKDRQCDGLWGLGLAVVTTRVNYIGENATVVSVLDNSFPFYFLFLFFPKKIISCVHCMLLTFQPMHLVGK